MALLLSTDRLARFSARSRRLEWLAFDARKSGIGVFRTFERAPDGSVWIVGDTGVVHFQIGPSGDPKSWQEYPFGTQPIENAQFPVACPDGELFLTAVRKGSRDRVIVVLKEGRWTLIEGLPQSSHASFAWRDGRGDLWLVSNLLYRKPALSPDAGWTEVDSDHPSLSGINDVLVNPDGTFFMASGTGIAYHLNSAWKVYTSGKGSGGNSIQLKQHMSAMLEDAQHRLWMIGKNSLFRFYHDQWEEYPLPSQYITDFNQRDLLVELPGSKILIQLQVDPYFGIFDPDTLKISKVKLVDGYQPMMVFRRPNGEYLVAMIGDGASRDALGILKDGALSLQNTIDGKWNVHYPRGMVETTDGRLWIGGTGGVGLYTQGHYEHLKWVDKAGEGPKVEGKTVEVQSVFSILPDEQGREVLIGSREFLCRSNGRRLEFLTSFPLSIKLIRDRRGALWAATPIYLRRTLDNAASLGFRPYQAWIPNTLEDGLPMVGANSVLEDSQGKIWAITSKGPAVFQPHTDDDPPMADIRIDQNTSEAVSSGAFRVIFTGRDKWGCNAPLDASILLSNGWRPLEASRLRDYGQLPESAGWPPPV